MLEVYELVFYSFRYYLIKVSPRRARRISYSNYCKCENILCGYTLYKIIYTYTSAKQKHKLHASDIFNCKIEITYDRNDTF